jgi:hypothetical protein
MASPHGTSAWPLGWHVYQAILIRYPDWNASLPGFLSGLSPMGGHPPHAIGGRARPRPPSDAREANRDAGRAVGANRLDPAPGRRRLARRAFRFE